MLNRIHIGEHASRRLITLKTRTGLTPNLLMRYGFCLSISQPGIPDEHLYDDGQVKEFNRYTLTGEYDSLFFGLLRERLIRDKLDPEDDLEAQFKVHMSRGIHLMHQRVKSLTDLTEILVASAADWPDQLELKPDNE